MKQGSPECGAPHGEAVFTAGSGGFVNSNALHMPRVKDGEGLVVSPLHILNPLLISGQSGSIINRKYASSLITASHVGIIRLYPDQPSHVPASETLRQSFRILEDDCGYRIRSRSVLFEIRYGLLAVTETVEKSPKYNSRSNRKIKIMLAFIHECCGDRLLVEETAASTFISERECSRVFWDYLSMTPVECVTNFRLQWTCWMLSEGNEPIISICHVCDLGNSSYFGRVFRSSVGHSSKEYRQKWQNSDTR